MPLVISLDVKELMSAVEEAMVDTTVDLIEAVTEAFNHDTYFWPNRTRRTNGETVSSPRNVVDSGELRDSWQLVHVSGTEMGIEWEAPYALEVFKGGARKLPRDVPVDTLLTFDLNKVFESHLQKRL